MEVTLRLLAPERMASRSAVAASESGNLPPNRCHIKSIYIYTVQAVLWIQVFTLNLFLVYIFVQFFLAG
jgi:hypothetical protein